MRSLVPAALTAACIAVPQCAWAQGADPNLGRTLAANCAPCHGTDGHSVGGMPALAGRPRAQLERMLQEFRAGRRTATVMQQLARGYTDAEIQALSAFLSQQPAKP